MKKFHLFILIFAVGLLIGHYVKEMWQPQPAMIAEKNPTPTENKSTNTSVKAVEPSKITEPFSRVSEQAATEDFEKIKQALRTLSGAELYHFLSEHSLTPYLKKTALLRVLKDRFSQKYGEDRFAEQDSASHMEAVSRLGILQALSRDQYEQRLQKHASLVGFYKGVLFNSQENWIVKRQAYKNISFWSPHLSEKERSQILALTDKRTLASASISDQELAQQMVTHAK